MRKKCKNCGKEFEARDSDYELCPQCFQTLRDVESYLLKSYYDEKGNLIKEVYLETPEKIAKVFLFSKPSLTTKQLRDFFEKIKKARNTAYLKGVEKAKPFLWECSRDLEYQLGRKSIPLNFYKFMKYHLSMAERDLSFLVGFYEHLESVLAFFAKEKGGET